MGLIIDMNKNNARAERKAAADAMKLTGFNHAFMMFSFATFLRQGAYTKESFEKLLEESPFQKRNAGARGLDLRVSLENIEGKHVYGVAIGICPPQRSNEEKHGNLLCSYFGRNSNRP
jgi:hypothetical protein